jgi:hypothetical protein
MLLTGPPYPEHPSGATSYASASMRAFEAFFGTDEMTFADYVHTHQFAFVH